MIGQRIAIFGLGRSGLAVGRACLQLGAVPHVFDQTPEDRLAKRDALDEARSIGLNVTLGWDGDLLIDGTTPDVLVVNPAVARDHPILLRALDAGIRVIGEIEFAFLIAKAPIVAITGTNGKSTTTVMTYLCLQACGESAILCGNIFGSGYPEIPLTEAALNASADDILVAEVSSFQLEWIDSFRPVSAGITNIWPDHLDRYPSFAEYAATKHRIFNCMGPDDTAVIRANDPEVHAPGQSPTAYRSRLMRRNLSDAAPTEGPLVLTFGATGRDALVEDDFLYVLHRKIAMAEMAFDEPHNRQNAAMAALLAFGVLRWKAIHYPEGRTASMLAEAVEQHRLSLRRSVYDVRVPEDGDLRVLPTAVIDGLRDFRGLAHRMELLGSRHGIRVINNSMCTNPDAVIKSAQAVRDPAHLLIGGVNKNLDFRPLRHYLANDRHKAYLFGSDADSLNEMLGGGYPTFATMAEAFHAATEAAISGQAIMLAPGCASTDQFRDFRDRGNVFKEIALAWLDGAN